MLSRKKIGVLGCLLTLAALMVNAEESPRLFDVYNASNGLSDNSAQTIKCTKTGRLVITTTGQINFFDGHSFSYIDPSNENIYPLDKYHGHYHLYFDRYHHLWLKDNKSVTCVDLTTEKFTASIQTVFDEFGVHEKVHDLFADSDGELFLLVSKGLYCVGSKRTYVVRPDQNLQDLETYEDKYLLLFYEKGEVDVLELSTGKTVYLSKSYGPEDYKNYGRTSVLYEDGSTYYQIRTGAGGAILQSFNIGKWEWTEILRTPYSMSNIEKLDSTLYIPCRQGYWTYHVGSRQLMHYETLKLYNGRTVETSLNALVFDKQGGMWIGTQTWGLLYARPHNVPFTVYSWKAPEAERYAQMMEPLPSAQRFRDKQVNCVYRDSKGRTWVGTSHGLHLYQKPNDKLPVVYTRRDGLLNNVVHSVVEDSLNHIWVGTSYGLSCLIFDDKGKYLRMLSYNSYDHIPNESFINGKAMLLDDGKVVMQMLDHVLAFNPGDLSTLTDRTNYKIYPKLVKLLVNGNEVRTGEALEGHVILDKALTRTDEINVDYDLNSLSLTFSALNYFRPQQTCYRVRVLGVDEAWRVLTPYNSMGLVDGKGQLHLPLSALQPGSYTIQLQASMLPDEWITEPYEWVVNVNEPWWRTTGIFMLLALLLMLLFLLNVWLYVRNYGMRTRRSSEEQGIIRRIKQFADYGNGPNKELLAPSLEEITSQHGGSNGMSEEFLETMMKIKDTVRSKNASQLSIKMLSDIAGMELQPFYRLISANIYKDPQMLMKRVAVEHAEELLRLSDKDIADIAEECGFATPNYLISTFFREYQLLPEEYRILRLRN